MPAFQVVVHPTFSPTSCVTCGSNRDSNGFIDLLVESATMGFDEPDGVPIHDPEAVKPTIGHLYLCLTCLFQAATAAGCAEPAIKQRLVLETVELQETVAQLEGLLDEERSNKVVSLDDARALLAETRPKVKAAS